MVKATGVDGIPIELVKCLGEGKKEILSLRNKIYKEGEWPWRIHGDGFTTNTEEK